MKPLPEKVIEYFARRMESAGVPECDRGEYWKWVRYYFDFCRKYDHEPRMAASMAEFMDKLASKGQTDAQRKQASAAVNLLIASRGAGKGDTAEPAPDERSGAAATRMGAAPRAKDGNRIVAPGSRPTESREEDGSGRVPAREQGDPEGGRGASWEKEYRELEGAIKLRNYSRKTLAAYRLWTRKFQAFVRSKPPDDLNGSDAKEFLTDLAVRHGVAASTQNQAFNALLFFYRHALGREFGKLDGVVRAKRRPYVPVVLSRSEVNRLFEMLEPPHRLVGALLYGCGLRLNECLELRIQCFNLEAMLLTVHDGKGQKDRTVPLPESVLPEIRRQMEGVRGLHQRDLDAGYAGVFLPRQLEKKYRNAPKEFIWQWFFPAVKLTTVPDTGEQRRYHLHDSQVQTAVKRAAARSGITKRVTPHTLRHTFASHLLLAGYDLATIQRLLGHTDVKTTMIYLQTVPSRTVKEARSPLDLE